MKLNQVRTSDKTIQQRSCVVMLAVSTSIIITRKQHNRNVAPYVSRAKAAPAKRIIKDYGDENDKNSSISGNFIWSREIGILKKS